MLSIKIFFFTRNLKMLKNVISRNTFMYKTKVSDFGYNRIFDIIECGIRTKKKISCNFCML